MNIELGLITKILEDKDFQKVKDKQIKAYYLDKEHRKYFTFIEDFFNANGTVPTVGELREGKLYTVKSFFAV